eukprot:CAMPEP_0205800070 /NCGR_PEP_ID=MMETSP0205-20121125/1592_1 /ASSEMBLY_ACC=CAM_ASM_000278 /TAXON_ID=36767 /ORGANISM="Euplotes focardii, Strain TN1" /LENGTH=54 /DNA_ID=CAMNT_0053062517 /DNA_START=217 /DNA_END=377 /DNA_ORIENTATION=+
MNSSAGFQSQQPGGAPRGSVMPGGQPVRGPPPGAGGHPVRGGPPPGMRPTGPQG